MGEDPGKVGERRLIGWALQAGSGWHRRGRRTEPWGMPASKGQGGGGSGHCGFGQPFTVSCGEVWRYSSVVALLALSPTRGSLSSEQENETGSPEWFMGGLVFWGCDTAIFAMGSGHLFPGRWVLFPWVFPTGDLLSPQIVTCFVWVAC